MLMSFSHEDVQRLLQLLDSSQFDEMHLEAEGIKLSLRRNGATASSLPTSLAAAPVATFAAPVQRAAPAEPVALAPAAGSGNLLEVRAPMLGTFYGAPKPGAAPYVAIGDRVKPDSAIAIIEVMKLMNSISAGIEGVLVEVLVRDGDLVEFDQVLMRVRPD
jgi:acetyl-CoA carboxylase biotin carboxyl carrier protein